jgi:hypothetical protein
MAVVVRRVPAATGSRGRPGQGERADVALEHAWIRGGHHQVWDEAQAGSHGSIEFYRTPSAQKLVTYVAARLKGESVDNPYDAADVEIIEKFMASPAGTKLATVGQSSSVTQKMADVTGDTIENCGKAKTP